MSKLSIELSCKLFLLLLLLGWQLIFQSLMIFVVKLKNDTSCSVPSNNMFFDDNLTFNFIPIGLQISIFFLCYSLLAFHRMI